LVWADNKTPRAFGASGFEAWLRRRYYQATGEAPTAAEIRSALDLLKRGHNLKAPERAVHIRVTELAGHDLSDGAARQCASASDPAGMLPLPVPEQGASILMRMRARTRCFVKLE
jgi:hypothetical protein